MAKALTLATAVRTVRLGKGWTQDDLARRSGVSRTGISAIESGRLIPSTATALALARVLETPVEQLFWLGGEQAPPEHEWAGEPAGAGARVWRIEVGGRRRLYPVEPSPLGLLPHDGVFEGGAFQPRESFDPSRTLVLATCDPAVSLVAAELARRGDFRLVVLPRSSGAALEMLAKGLVHAAGVHLADSSLAAGNELEVVPYLGTAGEFRLIHAARWQSVVAYAHGGGYKTLRSLLAAPLRWVGREPGSGARRCLDELLGRSRRVLLDQLPRARDHQGVAEAIRGRWADAGVCLELTSDQAGLECFKIRQETYEICVAESFLGDPRATALLEALQSTRYRRALADLPGCDAQQTGEWHRVIIRQK